MQALSMAAEQALVSISKKYNKCELKKGEMKHGMDSMVWRALYRNV